MHLNHYQKHLSQTDNRRSLSKQKHFDHILNAFQWFD